VGVGLDGLFVWVELFNSVFIKDCSGNYVKLIMAVFLLDIHPDKTFLRKRLLMYPPYLILRKTKSGLEQV
jgi:hypothetical protein